MTYSGKLFKSCECAYQMSALKYAKTVLTGELRDPALSVESDVGCKSIKYLQIIYMIFAP